VRRFKLLALTDPEIWLAIDTRANLKTSSTLVVAFLQLPAQHTQSAISFISYSIDALQFAFGH
jgi:hypothetical protein